MSIDETPAIDSQRPPVGNLTDFVIGVDETNRLDIEVSIRASGKVIVFHSHKFKTPIAWFEFDLNSKQLDFVLEDGAVRDIGLPLSGDVAKHMQNAHQILTVLMDPETGEAEEGNYIPLILHRD
jgi:hypothetical protein